MKKIIFNYDKLKGCIKEKNSNLNRFANNIGISRTALYTRFNNTTFFSEQEILKACKYLDISLEDVQIYFFNEKVQETE